MKSLFNKYESYTDLAYEIDAKATDFIQQIIKDYPEASTRELELIINGCVSVMLGESRLRKAMKRSRAERSLRKADMEQQ